ncbi:hypothetical protein [Polymorphobacter fuscus]|uniref:Uncharacterized protein n=1 Tax=Sandarakinorhabdus fusca TaxID=1439888 RepID=A0A7C9LHI5_9SPHN|nr:hypothetical protein [Polymorphobacter fuscus]KAB7644370.1 hypothetical protein F9290_13585 [Polymorphobacter fuscus]MQT18287.1 hypothetical protein [Polymorphobacter fuscus]NJC08181.1 hypothetical protein [Polymorphobacter fuscus]
MTETPAAAAKRRRWISIGETVGILALVISGISLWDSHQDRVANRAATAAAARAKPAAVAPLVLTATADAAGETLRLASPNAERVIQTQTIVFPAALGVASVDTVGNPRIEADWFAAALHKAVGDDRKAGRLPIGVVTRYTDNGTEREDTAIYDIGHGWRERLLQRDMPVLEGITLVQRAPKNLQARLDSRWVQLHPAKE